MNDSIKRISLDIHSTGSMETVNTKRGDTARTLIISLVDGGLPYIIGEDCYAVFTGKKPDRNVVFNDCTIKDNTIIYAFTEQTVAVEGRVNCEIKLYGADGKLITSPKFTINVFGTVYNEGDEIESSDEFNALTRLVVEAQQATENANEAAQKAANTAKSLMVVEKAVGPVINLDDAIKQYLVSCRIFGKTTQAGTPTPDVPIDLVSVGDGGSVGVTVAGNNLLDTAKLTNGNMTKVEVSDDGYTIVATGGTKVWANADISLDVSHIKGRTLHLSYDSISSTVNVNSGVFMIYRTPSGTTYPPVSKPVVIPDDVEVCVVRITANNTETALASDNVLTIKGLRVSVGSSQQWEPYKVVQAMTIATPNSLPGIPVSSGGNYTDANGKRWICDEIDLARGVYVQRIAEKVFDGTENWETPSDTNVFGYKGLSAIRQPQYCLCSHSSDNSVVGTGYMQDKAYTLRVQGYIYCKDTDFSTVEDWKSMLAEQYAAGTPVTVQYILETPIETALSEEELTTYAALYTYRNSTTVSNDAGAYMELEYVMDAKKYIDSLVGSGTILPATVE